MQLRVTRHSNYCRGLSSPTQHQWYPRCHRIAQWLCTVPGKWRGNTAPVCMWIGSTLNVIMPFSVTYVLSINKSPWRMIYPLIKTKGSTVTHCFLAQAGVVVSLSSVRNRTTLSCSTSCRSISCSIHSSIFYFSPNPSLSSSFFLSPLLPFLSKVCVILSTKKYNHYLR